MAFPEIIEVVAIGSPLLRWGADGSQIKHDTIEFHSYLKLHVILFGILHLVLQSEIGAI